MDGFDDSDKAESNVETDERVLKLAAGGELR